jgi:hypothetical protein
MNVLSDLTESAEEFHCRRVETAGEKDGSSCGKRRHVMRSFRPSGSLFKNERIPTRLEGVVNFLPSSLDIGAIRRRNIREDKELFRELSDDEP